MDDRTFWRLLIVLLEFACLALAVYVAFQMYQYRNGWNDGIAYYILNSAKNQTGNCGFIFNQTGVKV